MDPVQHWAMIQSKLREARTKVLEAEGLTEDGLRSLEYDAHAHFGGVGDVLETDYGRVEMIYDREPSLRVRRQEGSVPFKHKLKLLKEEA